MTGLMMSATWRSAADALLVRGRVPASSEDEIYSHPIPFVTYFQSNPIRVCSDADELTSRYDSITSLQGLSPRRPWPRGALTEEPYEACQGRKTLPLK